MSFTTNGLEAVTQNMAYTSHVFIKHQFAHGQVLTTM